MVLTRIVSLSAMVCVMTAGAVQADSERDRDRRRGRSARAVVRHHNVYRPPVVVHRHAGPRVVRVSPFGSRLGYHRVHRPGLGIGIYIGSPYRYPAYQQRHRAYGYPYANPYGNPYGYSYQGHSHIYAVPPPNALYGGVRLDVTPRDAAVYVDGYYAGIVDDFDGALQRIALEPGPHEFEIAADGLETLAFDVHVRPHQTVRYRGDMRPIAP